MIILNFIDYSHESPVIDCGKVLNRSRSLESAWEPHCSI